MAKRTSSAAPSDWKKRSTMVRPDLVNLQSLYHGVSSGVRAQFERAQLKYLDDGASAEGLLSDKSPHDHADDPQAGDTNNANRIGSRELAEINKEREHLKKLLPIYRRMEIGGEGSGNFIQFPLGVRLGKKSAPQNPFHIKSIVEKEIESVSQQDPRKDIPEWASDPRALLILLSHRYPKAASNLRLRKRMLRDYEDIHNHWLRISSPPDEATAKRLQRLAKDGNALLEVALHATNGSPIWALRRELIYSPEDLAAIDATQYEKVNFEKYYSGEEIGDNARLYLEFALMLITPNWKVEDTPLEKMQLMVDVLLRNWYIGFLRQLGRHLDRKKDAEEWWKNAKDIRRFRAELRRVDKSVFSQSELRAMKMAFPKI